MPLSKIKYFLQLESTSGLFLLISTILALVAANSSFALQYQGISQYCQFVVNDVLMAVFFLVIGLELKRNYINGVFANRRDITLPAGAAIAGMVLPALLYGWINIQHPDLLKGWAIPVATDIAFALGTLSLCAPRISPPLKMFLLWLAIFDDIGAIIIIGFFYTQHLRSDWMLLACLIFVLLVCLNRLGYKKLICYLIPGAALWGCVLKAGIHPTIAGVLLALTIPYQFKGPNPLTRLEKALHPWVAFAIMPLFAFVNAGFEIIFSYDHFFNPLTLGIIFGLFIGKQAGILFISWIMIKIRAARLPVGATWLEFYGVALLCGIGFTMSLFLGTLCFSNDHTYLAAMRLGVIIGSLLSGICGAIVLLLAFALKKEKP